MTTKNDIAVELAMRRTAWLKKEVDRTGNNGANETPK
jgi:hypothetical protein